MRKLLKYEIKTSKSVWKNVCARWFADLSVSRRSMSCSETANTLSGGFFFFCEHIKIVTVCNSLGRRYHRWERVKNLFFFCFPTVVHPQCESESPFDRTQKLRKPSTVRLQWSETSQCYSLVEKHYEFGVERARVSLDFSRIFFFLLTNRLFVARDESNIYIYKAAALFNRIFCSFL